MTEIPEHLLKRSKAAKSGATGGGDGGSDDAPSAAVESAPAAAAAPAGPAALIEAAASMTPDKPAPEPEPDPPYIAAAKARKRMPIWAMGLVAALPVWALSYAGTMQQPEVDDPLYTEAATLYGEGCSACHGASGGGGTGYALSGGEVIATFPNPNDHAVHVARGSGEINGQPYGDPNREGGQRVAGDRGSMPSHLTLTQLELELIVFHERAVLGGEDTSSDMYVAWIESLRTRIEAGDEHELEMDHLLACATDMTPAATGGGVGCIGELPEGAEE